VWARARKGFSLLKPGQYIKRASELGKNLLTNVSNGVHEAAYVRTAPEKAQVLKILILGVTVLVTGKAQ
jgi:hypothetical protein